MQSAIDAFNKANSVPQICFPDNGEMNDKDKLIVAYLAKRFAETPLIKRASWSEVEDE